MGWPDYEALLTEHFEENFNDYDDFTYNMYIHTVIQRFEHSIVDTRTISQIFLNMVKALEEEEGRYQSRT